MRTKIISILMGLTFGLNATMVHAERNVVVNGNRLNNVQVQQLEQIHCGPIANGHYWLNTNTGIWGYAGNPMPQGHISDNCNRPERRPGLSERGLLFGPSDWLR